MLALTAPSAQRRPTVFATSAKIAVCGGTARLRHLDGILDTKALLTALDSGHLAGAGLDVTDPEPLPSGHALWERDDVIITPHAASRAALTSERRASLFAENMRRFAAGEPLLNVVDRTVGY